MSHLTGNARRNGGLDGLDCAGSGGRLAASDSGGDGLQRWRFDARLDCTIRSGQNDRAAKAYSGRGACDSRRLVTMKHHHPYVLDVCEETKDQDTGERTAAHTSSTASMSNLEQHWKLARWDNLS